MMVMLRHLVPLLRPSLLKYSLFLFLFVCFFQISFFFSLLFCQPLNTVKADG